jgi:hypothetical protein
MPSTILRRLVATTAVAATTAALAAVPTLAGGAAHAAESTIDSSTAARTGSSLSIRAVKVTVRPGGTSTLRGRLATPGADPAGRTVLLEARSQGTPGFTPVAAATSGAAGKLTLTVAPETTTAYRWRYAGSAAATRAVSGITRIRVRLGNHHPTRIRTTLSIRLKSVGDPEQLRIRGKLFNRAGLPGRRWVILSSKPAGSTEWGFASAARTDARGRVFFGIQPAQQTSYRLAFLGTPKLRPSRSGRVTVRMPSDVSISSVPGIIDPGGSAVVGGVVTDAGVAVPGATVNLVAKGMKKNAKWAVQQTGTTAADGSVSFSVAPAKSTSYRLHVVRGADIRPGTSPSTDVRVRAGSSLSIRGRSGVPGYIVEGQLRAGGIVRAGRTVTLQSLVPGATEWGSLATDVTNKSGHVEFVQPLVAGTQYRLAYEGEELFLPSLSGTVVS